MRARAFPQRMHGVLPGQDAEGRIDGLDQKFAWVLGIQVTTLVAIVAALLAR